MSRNIEIKARIDSVTSLLPMALKVAGASTFETIEQDDSFFEVPHGRLKLRRFADGSAELIQYERADTRGAKASDYVRAAVSDPNALFDALARALGVRGRVRKRRWVVLAPTSAGLTRIHLDRVDGLGDFMELEVVLDPGRTDDDGACAAEALMQALGLLTAERLAGAYLDLLPRSHAQGRPVDALKSTPDAG